jgi:hypothetical protein
MGRAPTVFSDAPRVAKRQPVVKNSDYEEHALQPIRGHHISRNVRSFPGLVWTRPYSYSAVNLADGQSLSTKLGSHKHLRPNMICHQSSHG